MTTATSVLMEYLDAQVTTIMANEAMVRRGEATAAHDFRVAARRLRSELGTFATLLAVDHAHPLIEELRWLGLTVGAWRDLDVARERLLGLIRSAPTSFVSPDWVAWLDATLQASCQDAQRNVVAELNSARFEALQGSLRGLMRAGTPQQAAQQQPSQWELVAPLLNKAEDAVFRHWDRARRHSGQLGSTEWHQTRKKAKAARYGWEAVAPLGGEEARLRAGEWAAVTESLGLLQDSLTVCTLLLRLITQANQDGQSVAPIHQLLQWECDLGASALASADKLRPARRVDLLLASASPVGQ